MLSTEKVLIIISLNYLSPLVNSANIIHYVIPFFVEKHTVSVCAGVLRHWRVGHFGASLESQTTSRCGEADLALTCVFPYDMSGYRSHFNQV